VSTVIFSNKFADFGRAIQIPVRVARLIHLPDYSLFVRLAGGENTAA
jgi:hypothetical protein